MCPALGMRRKRLSKTEKQTLLERIQANLHPEKEEISQLAKTFELKEGTIGNWLSKMRIQKKATEGLVSESE